MDHVTDVCLMRLKAQESKFQDWNWEVLDGPELSIV